MTDSYNVGYSVDALDDLREIYAYIANELLVPETAVARLGRIQKEVHSLDFLPARYALVELEPWHSMEILIQISKHRKLWLELFQLTIISGKPSIGGAFLHI